MTGRSGEAVRDVRIARSTGAKVVVVDLDHPESPVEKTGAERWAAYCEAHGSAVFVRRWNDARYRLGAPEEWCEGCAAVVLSNGGKPVIDASDGFSEEERERARETRRAKAEERAAEREAEKVAKAERRSAEETWSEFARRIPMIDAVWTDADRAEARRLAERQIEHLAAAAKAKRAEEAAEGELYAKVEPKPKRAKELDAIIREADETRDRERAAADAVRAERDRLGRRAFLRGASEEGWTVRRNGAGFVLARGDGEPVRIPPDYLPDEEMEVAR